MLSRYSRPGLFITATGTDIGKTTVTAALAAALYQIGVRTGLVKPIASGCPKYPGRGNDPDVPLTDSDLMPMDSLLAAQALHLDVGSDWLMERLAPSRYAAPISPHLAAELEGRPVDWDKIAAAFAYWETNCEVLLVEGAGGWLTPIDRQAGAAVTIADLAAAIKLPVLLVTTATLGSINTTLLTVESIRARNLPLYGLVINRAPAKNAGDLNEQLNLVELPRLCGAPLLAILPEVALPLEHPLPGSLVAPMLPFARMLAG